MKITQKLRDHMVQNYGMAADATDDLVKSAVVDSLMKEGGLTTKTLDELTAEVDPRAKVQEMVNTAVASAVAPLMDAIKALSPVQPQQATLTVPVAKGESEKTLPSAESGKSPAEMFAKGMPFSESVNVLEASHSYDGTKSGCVWQKQMDSGEYAAGKPAFILENSSGAPNAGVPRYINNPSQKERAKASAFLKFKLLKDIPELRDQIRMTEHEHALVLETVHKDRWVGAIHKQDHYIGSRMLKDMDIKAVLDESGTSRGDQAVPEYFDDMWIRTPLLSGELAPYIQYVPVSRGSSADSFSIGTPTFVTTASGSAITPFSTTSFVTAFDTTFFPASCGFELGLDFESDAVPDFADGVMAQIGEESKRWLDEQIAIGDGTTEPQGIFVATNTNVTAVSSHTFASLVFADIVKLAFGIVKEGRNAFGGSFTRFVMNDQQYRVLMQVATGVTGDTRPVFGMGWKDYMLADYPVSVQNNISNGNLVLCNLRGYRMYRRAGLSFIQDDSGRTNRLTNVRLILARMRWGGQMTLPLTYTAEMTT